MSCSLLFARRFEVLVALALGVLTGVGRGQTWREIQSPHFRVVTDGSERDGRAVAKEFEQMRNVFTARFRKATLETGAPLTIFAVREGSLKTLGPMFYKTRDEVAGLFYTGWEKQFAMVRLDSFGDENQVVVFHEYTHSVLHANLHWLPLWLDEGLAEFYGYTRFQSDKVYVGAPSVRYRHLKSEMPIPMAKMLTVTNSTYGKDARMNDLFYGEAWAAVHYMTFSPEMGRGAKLDQFMALMEGGGTEADAFQQVFGDTKKFDEGLAKYLSSFALNAGVLPPDKGLDTSTFAAKVLSTAEWNEELAAMQLGTGDIASAKVRTEAALAADANLASAHEDDGFVKWKEGDDAGAKAEWAKASGLDQGLYRARFALLMTGVPLREQSNTQLLATAAALDGIVQTAPKFAPAYVERALVNWRLKRMQDAYKDAVMGEKLAPWRAGYRLLAGYILAQGHQPEMASTYARMVAARWPGSDHDEAVELWELLPAGSQGDGAALKRQLPEDATVSRGRIVETACEKGKLSVTLQPAAGEALKLVSDGGYESGYSDTLWMGRDHYTTCYHLGGLPAVVAYRPGGKLVALEVRDDLPAWDVGAATPKAVGSVGSQ